MQFISESTAIINIVPQSTSRRAVYLMVGALSMISADVFLFFKSVVFSLVQTLFGSYWRVRFVYLWSLTKQFIKFLGIHEDSCEEDHAHSAKIRKHCSDSCPLCLSEFNHCVVATCGHRYCGNSNMTFLSLSLSCLGTCILSYWETKLHIQIGCPMCRRPISMLIKDFDYPSAMKYKKGESVPKPILDGIRYYNARYSNKPRTVKTFEFMKIK